MCIAICGTHPRLQKHQGIQIRVMRRTSKLDLWGRVPYIYIYIHTYTLYAPGPFDDPCFHWKTTFLEGSMLRPKKSRTFTASRHTVYMYQVKNMPLSLIKGDVFHLSPAP